VEGGLGEGPGPHAPRPGSGDGDDLGPFAGLVHARHDYAVVAGVGAGEEAVRAGGDLTGKAQGAGGDGGRERFQGRLVQGAAYAVVGDHLRYNPLQLGRVALALERGDGVARRVHEHQCRRGADGVLVPPRPEIRVVEDGVAHVVAGDGAHDGLVVALVLELGGVDADHDEGVAETFLQGAQLFDDVQAVDAAERPEIQEDDLAPQGL